MLEYVRSPPYWSPSYFPLLIINPLKMANIIILAVVFRATHFLMAWLE